MGLNNGKCWILGDKQKTSDTYRLILTLAAFQLVVMDVGNNSINICNVTLDMGNDGVGIRNIAADVGNNDLDV